MSGRINVGIGELRASAATARRLGEELAPQGDRTVGVSRTAAGELPGWSIGQALGRLADEWAPALAGTAERLTTTGANLEATAQGYEWNEQQIAEPWQEAR